MLDDVFEDDEEVSPPEIIAPPEQEIDYHYLPGCAPVTTDSGNTYDFSRLVDFGEKDFRMT